MRSPSYGFAYLPPSRARRRQAVQLSPLGKTALVLGVLLEFVALLRLLPAGAFIPLGLAFLAALALLFWHPLFTLAVIAAAVSWRIERRRRARRAYEKALDDEIPF